MQSLFTEIFDDDVDVDREIQLREPEVEITLRPYQIEAVNAVFQRWDDGDVATLVSLPTGTGKSVIFSEVMRRWLESNQ